MSTRKSLILTSAVLALGACNSLPSKPPAAVAAQASCQDMDLPIYFDEGSAALTGPAREVIADAGRLAARCRVADVLVEGLADYRGAPRANYELSQKRAEQVALALRKAGLPVPRFDVLAQGQVGAVAPNGDPELLRRRAEVLIRFTR